MPGCWREGGFEVGGVDVQAGGGDDDIALAAEEAELAGWRLRSRGRRWRATRFRAGAWRRVPCGAGEHVAADEDLAVVAEADFAAGEGFADGAAADVEGMVEGDEGGGLGHAVALDEGEAEAVPEGFELGRAGWRRRR